MESRRVAVLTKEPKTVALHYILSTGFFIDILCTLAYPLQASLTPHLTPIYLVCLRHVLHAAHIYEKATKSSQSRRRVITLCLLSIVQLQ